MPDAIVIGSGPNGLAAAIRLAEAGRSVTVLEAADTPGGAVRTEELTLPGFHHDVMSAVYPAGAASPVFGRMPLADFGLEWVHPEACYAHPLGGDRGAALYRDLDATAASLNRLRPGDGDAWAAFTRPFVESWDAVGDAVLAGFPPIGDWLRHTNIDELPQLFNVLRGEMSLVGPRPERPVFVEEFRETVPDYDLRHAVPGGMTGWAQVHGWRGRTSLRKRIQYDLDYIQRWSILARLPRPAHDRPARRLGQDLVERLEAADASGRLSGRAVDGRRRRPVCSVVIPTYNGRDLLATCLASIARHRPDPARLPIEVIVADDGSTDGTAEWLARTYPDVRLVRLEPNRGFCGAANAGIAAARGASSSS